MANLGMAYQMTGRDAETTWLYKSRLQEKRQGQSGHGRTEDRKRCRANLGMEE